MFKFADAVINVLFVITLMAISYTIGNYDGAAAEASQKSCKEDSLRR